MRKLVALVVLSLSLAACPPRPTPVDGGPAVTPSAWTDTARVVIETVRWVVPAAKVVLAAVLDDPARTQVGRALDAVADYAARLGAAVDEYEHRGGDRCAAHAAVGGLTHALVALCQTLADHGIALGSTLERVVDSVGAIGDALAPACQQDAGWGSLGEDLNATVRAIQNAARARGIVLRHDLDDLRPVVAR